MKKLLFLAASLCFATAAFSQPRGDGRGDRGDRGDRRDRGPSNEVYSLTKCRADLLNRAGQGEMFTAIVLPVGGELPQAACVRSVDFLCQSVLQTYQTMDRSYRCQPYAPVAVFGSALPPVPPSNGGGFPFPNGNGGGFPNGNMNPQNGGDLRLECYEGLVLSTKVVNLTSYVVSGNNVNQVVSMPFYDMQTCSKAREQAMANKGMFCQVGQTFRGNYFTVETIGLDGKVTVGTSYGDERQCVDMIGEMARRMR